jgi:DNA-binding NtrC family response regulator
MATVATRVVTRDGMERRVIAAVALEALLPSGEVIRARVEQPLYRVGADPRNDLALDDPAVSGQHLELEVTPDGYRISDLDSSNGTFLDGLRLGTVTIQDPVWLTLGGTRLSITPLGEEVEVEALPATSMGPLVGRSLAMRELFAQMQALAASDCSVLLEGETGVGKELVARTLHQRSPRASGPFVVVACGGLSAELIEDELFGHVRGAFSGADTNRAGVLEQARGGSVLLDDIDDLPLPMQAKLLGAIDRRRVQPIGGTPRAIDVRILATSQRDLAREVNQRRFRADLFYRLAVVRLRVPPLRERREDIPLLAAAFLEGAEPLSAVALAQLASHPWRGNVRQLRNTVERALLKLPTDDPEEPPADESLFRSRARALFEFERQYFARLLEDCAGNVRAVARAAQMDRRQLQRKLQQLGLLT